MVTIREVAARAGVSVATVSAVMTGKRRVSPELRERVEKALVELDYRPNALARALYSKRTNTIGFLVPAIANPGFSNALRQVEVTADAHGYAVLVCNTEGSPDRVEAYRHRLIDMRVDGVLLALTWELARPEVVEGFRRHGIAVVGLSGGRPVDGIDCFLADEEQGGYALGRYLQSLGHRRCAFIGPEQSAVANLRLSGLRKALAEVGETLPPELLSWAQTYTMEAGEEAALRLLGRGEPLSAVVVFNDMMAAGVMAALEGQGLSVPQEVSVATFGNVYAKVVRPQLTAMVYGEAEAGELAVRCLLNRIDGKLSGPGTTRLLPMELAIRASTRYERQYAAARSSQTGP